jgi:hypothetical protein
MTQPLRPILLLTAVWLLPTLVVIQAALTGQTWFAGAGLTGLHGGLGHAVLLFTGINTLISWKTAAPRAIAITFTALFGLVIAQIGLGYSGHRAALATASALHIPLGVTIAALAGTAATALTIWLRAGHRGTAS